MRGNRARFVASAAIGLLMLTVGASCHVYQGSQNVICVQNSCDITDMTTSQDQVTIFDGVQVIIANITGNSVDITIGSDTQMLASGDTSTVGGYQVTITSIDGSSDTVELTVSS